MRGAGGHALPERTLKILPIHPAQGKYGTTPMRKTVDTADSERAVVFQIEDRKAVGVIKTLAAMDEVDTFLSGAADLPMS